MGAVIVFVRIPKTASQTLAGIARQNYPRQQARGLANMFTDAERSRAQIEQAAREYEHVALLSGHIAFERRGPRPPGARYFTMLREPVKRAISHYHAYIRRLVRDGRDPDEITIEQVIAERPLQVPDNMQTRQLSGHASLGDPPFGGCTPKMLEGAKRNIARHFEVVGLTERFDESVVLLGEAFGWRDLAYTPVNVWNSPPARGLSGETVHAIYEANLLDLKLYQFVQERFARLVAAQANDFAEKVEALRLGTMPSETSVARKLRSC